MSIEKIAKNLQKGTVVLVSSETNRHYLSGFKSSLGYLFISQNKSALYLDSRYFESAKCTVKNTEVRLLQKLSEAVDEFLDEYDCDKILIEDEITLSEFTRYKELTGKEFDYSSLSDEISKMRIIKSSVELGKMKNAQKIAERAFLDTLPLIKAGVCERDIAAELEYKIKRFGAEDISFDTIVVGGKNSALPHGVPTDYKLQNGDFVTIDFGAVVEGYHSDTTRTIALGSVTDKMKQVYDTVKVAQDIGLMTLKNGAACKDCDKAAREVIEEAGYGEFFGHGTGHGVGLNIHEAPNLSPNSEEVLESGMVVTVEPGIYLQSEFGVRIEDMAFITENGYENLTSLSKDLIIL